jgi:putative transposase
VRNPAETRDMRRRHNQIGYAGVLHFVTTVTKVRGDWFVDEGICRSILKLFDSHLSRFKLDCFGYVLMPDHLHCLLLQVDEGQIVSNFMRMFKTESSKRVTVPDYSGETLWCECYDDVPVPGKDAAITKLNYMLNNPVRRGIVNYSLDYPWSSAKEHFGVGKGIVKIAST